MLLLLLLLLLWLCISLLFAELLRRQDALHLRLWQTQAFHAVCETVLWQWLRHWRVRKQKNKGHLKAVQEEAICEKYRLYVVSSYLPNCSVSCTNITDCISVSSGILLIGPGILEHYQLCHGVPVIKKSDTQSESFFVVIIICVICLWPVELLCQSLVVCVWVASIRIFPSACRNWCVVNVNWLLQNLVNVIVSFVT